MFNRVLNTRPLKVTFNLLYVKGEVYFGHLHASMMELFWENVLVNTILHAPLKSVQINSKVHMLKSHLVKEVKNIRVERSIHNLKKLFIQDAFKPLSLHESSSNSLEFISSGFQTLFSVCLFELFIICALLKIAVKYEVFLKIQGG